MEKSQERQLHKTSEGEFIFELHHEYELSPRESESILETAKRCLIRENILKEGEIEVSVISIEERSGKMVENMRKVRVRLTIDERMGDLEILKNSGRVSLRRVRIQRVSQEAIEQNGILSQEDLGKYLSCDVRTIKRDIREIKQSGIEVITRGVLHNIGRGQTHKVKIVGLFLEGKTFSEIKLKTKHSSGAIKRYIQDFQKVIMSNYHGIKDAASISHVTGLSITIVTQYIELIAQSRKDKHKKVTMEEMISQWKRAGRRLKKKEVTTRDYIGSLAPMTGGVR